MMRPPRLASCYFADDAAGIWPRLARVLKYSATRHCPGWDIDIHPIAPGALIVPGATPAYLENTQKLEWWTRQVLDAEDGDRILLVDTDTMVTGALDPLWDLGDFDVALTCRPPGAAFPLNGGVIGVRVNARSRAFFETFNTENGKLLTDRPRHEYWRQRYGGINQAALGILLTGGAHGARVLQVPCRAWNCEDSTWASYHSQLTRIVHIKSALRRAVFFDMPIGYKGLGPLVRIWHDLEAQATAAGIEVPLCRPAPIPDAPVTKTALARPAVLQRRGRPKGPDTVVTSVRISATAYDAYCRRAVKTRESVHSLLKRAIEGPVRPPTP